MSGPPFNPEPGSQAPPVLIDTRVTLPPIFAGLGTGQLDVAAGKPLSAEQPYLKPPPYADSHAGSDSRAEARGRVPPGGPVDPDHYSAYVKRSVRRLQRAAWIVSVFVLGLGAGLAGAWWLNGHLSGQPVRTAAAEASRLKVPSSAAAEIAIGMSEKPYDGIPADQRDRAANAGSGDFPYDGKPLSTSDPTWAVTGNSGGKQPFTAGAGGSLGEGVKAAEPEVPMVAKVDGSKAAEAVEMGKAAEGLPPPNMRAPTESRSASKPAAKPANAQRKAKKIARDNKEIARIKRQVDEELNRIRTDGIRAPRDTGAHAGRLARDAEISFGPGASAKRTSHALNQCERLASAYFSGVIRREQCKWRVCKNQWGKNGCASYQPQNASNY